MLSAAAAAVAAVARGSLWPDYCRRAYCDHGEAVAVVVVLGGHVGAFVHKRIKLVV